VIYERLKAFYRAGWRPALGWGLAVTLTLGGLYEFFLRHYTGGGPNDVMAFVAYLTAAGGLVFNRSQDKAKGVA
jgi:hypothetical protein